MEKAEIIVSGRVQGVGFRYFVMKNAEVLGLSGFTQNLANGSVLTVVEGEKSKIEELYHLIRKGPSYSHVSSSNIVWQNYLNEFNSFEVRY